MSRTRYVLLVARGDPADELVERSRGWLSACGIRAKVVGPDRSAIRTLIHVWRRLPDAGQIVLSRSVSPWSGAAIVVLSWLRGGRPHLYEVEGLPSASPWSRSWQRFLAKTARVVIVPSMAAAMVWGRLGAPWNRLHVVPRVPSFPPDPGSGRAARAGGSRGHVVLTTSAHERSVAEAVGTVARIVVADGAPVPFEQLLAEADVVVTDVLAADLDPWAALAARRPVVLVLTDATADLAVAPFREMGLPVVAPDELGGGIEDALQLDAPALVRHAQGYVSEAAVAPHYVHAVASAAPS